MIFVLSIFLFFNFLFITTLLFFYAMEWYIPCAEQQVIIPKVPKLRSQQWHPLSSPLPSVLAYVCDLRGAGGGEGKPFTTTCQLLGLK